MSNKEIEYLLKQEKIYKWQVAKRLGIHETTFVRWFRNELTKEQVNQVILAVEEIKLDRLTNQK